jgi:GNAT superfamily N-acetyltransferase
MTYVPPISNEHVPRIAERIADHEEVWLAEDHDRLLGFLGIARSRRHGWEVVEGLYVEPDAQGRGVGTALLEQAKALRPDGLYLWVFQKNMGARRFYERHGFRLVTLRFGAAAENMENEPDALYAWPGVSLAPARAASSPGSSAR